MAWDNGSGSGGGNGSVYWQIKGSATKTQPVLSNLAAAGVAGAAAQTLAAVNGAPGKGELKLGKKKSGEALIEGHDETNFDAIGVSNPPKPDDHPGMFRVRLRISQAALNTLIQQATGARKQKLEAYRTALPELARRLRELTGEPPRPNGEALSANDVFLVIDVPALRRTEPAPGQEWPENEPWEIHWQW